MQNNVFNEYFAKGQFYEMVNGVKTLVPEKYITAQIAAGVVDTNLVSAVTGKEIQVLSFMATNRLAVAGSFSLNTKPAGAGSVITPRFYMAANANLILDPTRSPRSKTVVSQGLTISTVAVEIDITVCYIEVTV